MMQLIKSFKHPVLTIVLGSLVAIATPASALAQNQSDVTGPNLSDITGPNQSDITGPNQSDNTGVLGERIFRTPGGEFVTLGEVFQRFFDDYGDDLGLDPNDSLVDKLRAAKQACSSEGGGTRRFSRTPGSTTNKAICDEFTQLVDQVRQTLIAYQQGRGNQWDRRAW